MDLSLGWLWTALVIDLILLWWANWTWIQDMQLGIFLACVFIFEIPFLTVLSGCGAVFFFQILASRFGKTAAEEIKTLGMVFQNGFLFLWATYPSARSEGTIMFVGPFLVYIITAWIYRRFPPAKKIERVDTAMLLFAVVVCLLFKYIIHLYIGP